MTEPRCDDPTGLAREYMLLGAEGTVCPHGVDRWEGRLRWAITGSEWLCKCCCHRFFGPMPEGGLCGDCDA